MHHELILHIKKEREKREEERWTEIESY
jgi:hypothetical protein